MKKTIIILFSVIILFASCTFDYGQSGEGEKTTPDLVMENVEYVRVRSADPIALFRAERAERYEAQGVMKLTNFSFEQYGEKGEEINTLGKAGFASIHIESGDFTMDDGVRIEIESEDIILETKQLEWKDEPRILTTGQGEEVHIYQESGTHFIGIGLVANARERTYEFTGMVSGTFISVDDEDEEEESTERSTTPRTRIYGVDAETQRPHTPADTVPQRPQEPDETDKPDEPSIEEAELLKDIDPEDIPSDK